MGHPSPEREPKNSQIAGSLSIRRQLGTYSPAMCVIRSKHSEPHTCDSGFCALNAVKTLNPILVTLGFIPNRPPLSKPNKAEFNLAKLRQPSAQQTGYATCPYA
jgi:hypothetical protein